MIRKVLAGFVLVCLILGMVPSTSIAQPSPPTEFEGTIQDKDIIPFKTGGGYEIGLHNNLVYSELDVFFDGVYQSTIPKGPAGKYFTVDQKINHVIVAATKGSHEKAWHRYLSEEDWQEYYIQLKKSEIEDIDLDKKGIQVKGIIEIPFTYNVPDGLEWNAEIIYLDGKKIWYTLDTRDYSNPKVKLTSPATIKLATHLFENGTHNITVELVDSGCGEEFCSFYVVEKSCRDTVFLDFQNTFVVPENWEGKYSEPGIIPDFHPDFGVEELKKNYSSIYNSLINEWKYEDNEILGAEVEFVSAKEIGLKKIFDILKTGSGIVSLADIGKTGIAAARCGAGLVKIAKSIGGAILVEGVFIAIDEFYKGTTPDEELYFRYSEAPSGDLAGNKYVVYVMTEFEKDYCNAKINWKGKFPFFLNEKGEWQFYFGNSYEIEDAEWDETKDCIESREMTEEGETKTFKLTIKDNVIPNLNDEAMHLDLELPKGVEISNVRVKGAEDRRLEEGELYKVSKKFNQLTIAKSAKGEKRIAINIPKVYPSAECEELVVFDITVEEGQPVPLKIFYGLIPTKVHRGNALTKYGWNNLFREDINLITVKHPKGDPKQPDYMVHFYEPFELKQSFEITPSIPSEIDFNVLLKPDKTTYQRGETAQVTIDVTNNRDQDTEIWLGTTFKYPTLKDPEDIQLKRAVILKGETESFDIDWTIPADAPLGQYEIAVNCWKDAGQNEYYTDNIVWAPIFTVDTTTPVLTPPSHVLTPQPSEFDLDALLALISDFFEAVIGAISDLVTSLQQKPIDAPPEEKARANVEDALGALAGMANAYSGVMGLISDLAEVEPPRDAELKFEYHVLSARFCNNIAEAELYMSSGGIESAEMNDALELVGELELEKTGFCIVIVDYSFIGFGEYESGKYPIVCNEKGDPFWESWQFYEKIKEEIEGAYKDYP